MLNERFNEEDRIVKMLDFFVYRKHLCIAFEILSVNLYDVLKQNGFRGLSTLLIRNLIEQIVRALQCLRKARIIHCDLKPENVLLSTTRTTQVKLIDFGSACFEGHIVYTYIQSRFYRSPEVLFGLPYSSAIDIWSLGCICAELYIGLPVLSVVSLFAVCLVWFDFATTSRGRNSLDWQKLDRLSLEALRTRRKRRTAHSHRFFPGAASTTRYGVSPTCAAFRPHI